MANNCLITKLKSVVDNDNLLKLGEVRIKMANGTLSPNGSATFNITSVGNAIKLNGGTTVQVTPYAWPQITVTGSTGDTIGEVSIDDKYHVTSLLGPLVFENGLKDLQYMPISELGAISFTTKDDIRKNNIELSEVAEYCPNITKFNIWGKNVKGNISDLFPLKDQLIDLAVGSTIQNWDVLSVHGTFDDLGHFYKINAFGDLITILRSVDGTVEGFVANRLAEQPNTAGSVTVSWLGDGGRITWEDAVITNVASDTIAWDAQGNITVNGQSHNPNA